MKIYSFKTTGNGARITGRIKASDMQDATNQVVLAIHGRPMDISVVELKNQKVALAQWERDHTTRSTPE